VDVGAGKAQLGGGTLPRSTVPSVTLNLQPHEGTLADFAARLRVGDPPVIGYLGGGRFKLDLRTVFADQDADVVRALRAALVPARP
jgi:L-seryl-tRNA(Ser) seleniumtransferase